MAKKPKKRKLDSRMQVFADGFRKSSDQLVVQFLNESKAAPVRSLRQFAREEIILPSDGGPFEGEPFNPDCQPYVDLLYEQLEIGGWSEIFITGPNQSGKTLSAFVIIIVYIAAELRKNVIVGVPTIEMADDKWEIDIAPVFRASPTLSKLLPKKGPGSEGGKVKDSVTLNNGVVIKFMTKGGSDASKAGFTSGKAVLTEAPAWSKSVGTSEESSPLDQIRARQFSISQFDDDGNVNTERQLVVEGTLTVEHELPWTAKKHSSDSVLMSPCVHCKDYVAPEREHFGGFEKAKDEFEAKDTGTFFCPKCGEAISESERIEMVRNMKLIHKGQKINKQGKITGARPKTFTLFFRWSAFQNLFVSSAELGLREWKAAQLEAETPERENAERALCQQTWAIPFKMKLVDAAPLVRAEIRRRTDNYSLMVCPPNTVHLCYGVDVGRWKCWYFAIAFRDDGTLHCPVYGAMDTSITKAMDLKTREEYEGIAIRTCLHEIFDLIETGMSVPGSSKLMIPELTFVDTRYAHEVVFDVIKERGTGRKGPFMAIQGVGKSQLNSRQYSAPRRRGGAVRKIGDGYHIEYTSKFRQQKVVIDVDDSKLSIQKCLRVTPGLPGALTLAAAPQQNHTTVSHHLASEFYRRFKDKDGTIKEEFKKFGANHLLDCAGYAWVAGKLLGWSVQPQKQDAKKKKRNTSWLDQENA